MIRERLHTLTYGSLIKLAKIYNVKCIPWLKGDRLISPNYRKNTTQLPLVCGFKIFGIKKDKINEDKGEMHSRQLIGSIKKNAVNTREENLTVLIWRVYHPTLVGNYRKPTGFSVKESSQKTYVQFIAFRALMGYPFAHMLKTSWESGPLKVFNMLTSPFYVPTWFDSQMHELALEQ